jgi:hypothetical protein
MGYHLRVVKFQLFGSEETIQKVFDHGVQKLPYCLPGNHLNFSKFCMRSCRRKEKLWKLVFPCKVTLYIKFCDNITLGDLGNDSAAFFKICFGLLFIVQNLLKI